MAHLASSAVPSPRLLRHGTLRARADASKWCWPYVIATFVGGSGLGVVVRAGSRRYDGLPATVLATAVMLAKLHDGPLPSTVDALSRGDGDMTPACGCVDVAAWLPYLRQLAAWRSTATRRRMRTGSLHAAAIDALDAFLPAASPTAVAALLPRDVRGSVVAHLTGRCHRRRGSPVYAAAPQPALLHGDVTAENVRVTASGDAALIDFGDVTIGDPLYDWVAFAAAVLGSDVAAVAAATFVYNNAGGGGRWRLRWCADTAYRATCLLAIHPVDAFALLTMQRPHLFDGPPSGLWQRMAEMLWPASTS